MRSTVSAWSASTLSDGSPARLKAAAHLPAIHRERQEDCVLDLAAGWRIGIAGIGDIDDAERRQCGEARVDDAIDPAHCLVAGSLPRHEDAQVVENLVDQLPAGSWPSGRLCLFSRLQRRRSAVRACTDSL